LAGRSAKEHVDRFMCLEQLAYLHGGPFAGLLAGDSAVFIALHAQLVVLECLHVDFSFVMYSCLAI